MFSKILVTLLCSILITAPALAGYAGTQGAFVRFGGSPSGDFGGTSVPLDIARGQVYMVVSNGNAGGALTIGNYNSFAKIGGIGGQWVVPRGKVAVCVDQAYTLGANNSLQFGYGTAAFADHSASAPTGAACYSAVACASSSISGSILFQSSANYAKHTLVFDATTNGPDANIFPFYRGNTNNTVQIQMTCIEQ